LRYEILEYGVATAPIHSDSFSTVVTDIGLGGVQLRGRYQVPIGSPILVQIGRPKGRLNLSGEVRHCLRVPDSELYCIGVRFMPESHEERLAIAEYVHDVFQRQCDLLGS
jgi:hypothetical protein